MATTERHIETGSKLRPTPTEVGEAAGKRDGLIELPGYYHTTPDKLHAHPRYYEPILKNLYAAAWMMVRGLADADVMHTIEEAHHGSIVCAVYDASLTFDRQTILSLAYAQLFHTWCGMQVDKNIFKSASGIHGAVRKNRNYLLVQGEYNAVEMWGFIKHIAQGGGIVVGVSALAKGVE